MPSLTLRCLLTIGLMLLAVAAWAHWPIKALPAGTVADRVLIEKAARRLTLFRGTTVVQSYAVSLGLAPVGAKEREGGMSCFGCTRYCQVLDVQPIQKNNELHLTIMITTQLEMPSFSSNTAAKNSSLSFGAGYSQGSGFNANVTFTKKW